MTIKLRAGQTVPAMQLKNIHGRPVVVPDPNELVHLQFRRFAGCPVCNLHLQSFVGRIDELSDSGVKEVVFFHSGQEELLPYQGQFQFDVIGDPDKVFYRQFGVESSVASILNPGAWSAMVRGILAKDKPAIPLGPAGGPFVLPADFLISRDGTLAAVHYGTHADDQWSVDEVIALATSAGDLIHNAP